MEGAGGEWRVESECGRWGWKVGVEGEQEEAQHVEVQSNCSRVRLGCERLSWEAQVASFGEVLQKVRTSALCAACATCAAC